MSDKTMREHAKKCTFTLPPGVPLDSFKHIKILRFPLMYGMGEKRMRELYETAVKAEKDNE